MTLLPTATLLPVVFTVYNMLAFGKNKGKVDPRSLHSVTLMRDTTKGETVAETIKRLKLMYSSYHVEGTGRHSRVVIDEPMRQRFKLESAQETEGERLARYERDGLEVISVAEVKDEGVIETFNAVRATDKEWEELPIAVGDVEVETLLAAESL